MSTATPDQRPAWYRPISLARSLAGRPKLLIAVASAIAASLLLPREIPAGVRTAVAWNVGGLVYVTLTFRLMWTCTVDIIRQRAEREDESRFVFLTLVLLAIAASFTAAVGLIGEAKGAKGEIKAAYLALAGLSILVSWTVTQIVFTLHYAHDYYRPVPGEEDAAGGLKFPGDGDPDYWDFFYFTTSIGAASQTSDVAITSKALRRWVSFQAVVSFVFNTTVLALAINLAASLI